MTDAHCHVSAGGAVRELLIGRDFVGIHPWDATTVDEVALAAVREKVKGCSTTGVGEIGLDRLKVREIPARMREVFLTQLEIAAEFHRPVVLHGAKCWGQVVTACKPFAGRIPAFLFHGFSRSDGLISDIAALNGFISVGPALLNDHAVNYRELVRRIPADRLLVETDRTTDNFSECPSVFEVAKKLAEVREMTVSEVEAMTDANVGRFLIYL